MSDIRSVIGPCHTATTSFRSWLQCDQELSVWEAFGQQKEWDSEKPLLLYGHPTPEPHYPSSQALFTELVVRSYPTSVTLRDPLRCLISSFIRGAARQPHLIVDQFLAVMGWEELVGYHPMDLKPRFHYIRGMPHLNCSDESHPLKEMYAMGDTRNLASWLGEPWYYLVSVRDKLQPFLRKQGYREFLW